MFCGDKENYLLLAVGLIGKAGITRRVGYQSDFDLGVQDALFNRLTTVGTQGDFNLGMALLEGRKQ